MFEQVKQPLLPPKKFAMRMATAVVIAIVAFVLVIGLGIVMFCATEHQSFVDAMLNSVMVMTGLGLVTTVSTTLGKTLLSFYAVLSAVMFYSILGVLFSPLLHRLLHSMHVDAHDKS